MNWLSQFFINPGYAAAGIGLILLPILIHLINRYRYRRVRWAAMEFLLQSKKQNQRKLLLQQFLLLMLRIGAVLGIVALIARPYFDPGQLQLLRGERSHHLVILDDSLSMQDRTGGKSAFEEGIAVVNRLAEEGARRSGTQTMTLLLLSKPSEPVLTQVSLDSPVLSDLQSRLEKLRCRHQPGNITTGLTEAVEHLRHPAASKTLHLISDFREREWDQGKAYAAVARLFKDQEATINLIRAVPTEHENLGITRIDGDLHSAAVRVPLRLSCTVKNFGKQVAKEVSLIVSQDERKLPLSIKFDEIEAGQELTQQFDVQFSEPGAHTLKVELPVDSLEGDNSRYLAINLPTEHRVLIINGNAGDDEGLLAADALSPISGLTGFAPIIEDPEYLRRQPLDQFQAIHLVNVPELPADSLRILTEFVSNGGGLSWHVGPAVRPRFYNEQLFARGAGLFPLPLSDIREFHPDVTNPAPDLLFEDHPIFKAFQGEDNPFVSQVKIDQYFAVPTDVEIPDTTRIIGRLSNQSPLVAEKLFGKGRVIASLTSCGNLWNNWPRNPSYVLFWLELEKYLMRNPLPQGEHRTGEPIEIRVDPTEYRSLIEIRTPDTQGTVRINLTAPKTNEKTQATPKDSAAPDGAPFELHEQFRETDLPGIYRIVRYRQDDSTDLAGLAYNVPSEEGDLTLASNETIQAALEYEGTVRIQAASDLDWAQGKFAGQEVRDLILFLLAGLLFIEQLLAMKLSFHPNSSAMSATRSSPQEVRA